MSRTLRSPMVRGSTVLLGLGVLLWLFLRAPIPAPHHGLQAYAPFQILARAEFGLRSVSPRNSNPAFVLLSQDKLCSPTLLPHADPRDRLPSVLALTEVADKVLDDRPASDGDGCQSGPGGEPEGPRYRGAFTANDRPERKSLKRIF